MRDYYRRFYAANREKDLARRRAHHDANRDRELARKRARAAANREKGRIYKIARKYGLTLEGYNDLVRSQGGRCAICGAASTLCVDHDHATGRVRGLLCHNCNRGIGLLGDDAARVGRAAEYLAAEQRRPLDLAVAL
jgi:hypothetical protein